MNNRNVTGLNESFALTFSGLDGSYIRNIFS